MTAKSKALEILKKAESELQATLGEAASEGDYEEVLLITSLAKGVASLALRVNEHGEVESERNSSALTSSRRTSVAAMGKGNRKNKRAVSKKPAKRSGRASRSKTTRSEYPKFFRRGEDIVRIGWSKKSKKEYRHKACRELILQVGRAVAEKMSENEITRADKLMPIFDADGNSIPSYQVYLCLAWFKSEDLIVQHGREGYTVKSVGNLNTDIIARWKLLEIV